MATQSSRLQRGKIGSRAWVTAEKENAAQLTAHEIEEAMYPAQYEMEWLNECMADIFSGEMDFTEILKTPGALRGKTPRSSKRAMATPRGLRAPSRAPFSSDSTTGKNSRFAAPPFEQELPQIRESNDSSTTPPTIPKDEQSRPEQPDEEYVRSRGDGDHPADSGYLELASNRDKDKEAQSISRTMSFGFAMPTMVSTTPARPPARLLGKDSEIGQREVPRAASSTTEARQSNPGSRTRGPLFNQRSRLSETDHPPLRSVPHDQYAGNNDSDDEPEEMAKTPFTNTARQETSNGNTRAPGSHLNNQNTRVSDRMRTSAFVEDHATYREPAPPTKPPSPLPQNGAITRPSRERSLSRGYIESMNRSNSSHDHPRLSQSSYIKDDNRANIHERSVDNGATHGSFSKDRFADEDLQDRAATKRETKTSTQLLHERISMLGQSRPPRLSKSKSITASQPFQVHYPDLSQSKSEYASNPDGTERLSRKTLTMNDNAEHTVPPSRAKASFSQTLEDGDQRAPTGNDELRQQTRSQRTSLERRSLTRQPSVEEPPYAMPQSLSPVRAPTNDLRETPTSQTSPSRFGKSLTASKMRLQSIMKSAKGIFSGGAPKSDNSLHNRPENSDELNAKGNVTYPQLYDYVDSQADQRPETPTPASPKDGQLKNSVDRGQYTPHHAESGEAMSEENIDFLTNKPTRTANMPTSAASNATQLGQTRQQTGRNTNNAPTYDEQQASRSVRQSNTTITGSAPDYRQPAIKPIQNTQNTRPAPSNIRLGALPSQCIQMNNAISAESEMKDNMTNAPRAVNQKPSNSGLQSTGARTSNMAPAQTRQRAAVTAQARREQEREVQRKKALGATESGKEKAKEQGPTDVSNDPKRTALQAIERRRIENAAKKLHLQQQQQQKHQTSAPASSRSSTNVTQKQPAQRTSVTQPPARPTSRLGSITSASSFKPGGYMASNQPKSAKRPLGEDQGAASSRFPVRKLSVVQQFDGKRRKTEEEADYGAKPTMAPPIRQSAVRKIVPPQRAPSYGLAQTGQVRKPSTSAAVRTQTQKTSLANNASRPMHQAPSQGPPNRHPGHPMDMSKYANGKIPFANAHANQQTPASKNALSQSHASHSQNRPKSSPMYPSGDNISLPDIDSEESDDSEAETHGMVPEWAQPENLRDLLVQQEGEDGENVFGPTAPLKMEEIFKDSKHRHRFRDRTSSANWSGPDGLTREEILRDIEARERLKRNGGWTYGI